MMPTPLPAPPTGWKISRRPRLPNTPPLPLLPITPTPLPAPPVVWKNGGELKLPNAPPPSLPITPTPLPAPPTGCRKSLRLRAESRGPNAPPPSPPMIPTPLPAPPVASNKEMPRLSGRLGCWEIVPSSVRPRSAISAICEQLV
ncbi:hypothetical protein DL93DRAFT_309775 [Clavulina sp. PMI_390]|nr:hypothetical protein DL93DRAFT_309775 [Clavulina sp. PMI_390]